ncbi:hypothetical protein KEM52_002180 [Ascosphaera acerosa]|nr:hypothetical protein KEM52_002180 [Ascosphaera acerosa]
MAQMRAAEVKRYNKRELSTSKRAEQNRAAQRAFRQRKETYIRSLERQVEGSKAIVESYEALRNENMQLRDYIIQLQSRMLDLHGEIPEMPSAMKTPVAAPSAESIMASKVVGNHSTSPPSTVHNQPTTTGDIQQQQQQQQQQQEQQQQQQQQQQEQAALGRYGGHMLQPQPAASSTGHQTYAEPQQQTVYTQAQSVQPRHHQVPAFQQSHHPSQQEEQGLAQAQAQGQPPHHEQHHQQQHQYTSEAQPYSHGYHTSPTATEQTVSLPHGLAPLTQASLSSAPGNATQAQAVAVPPQAPDTAAVPLTQESAAVTAPAPAAAALVPGKIATPDQPPAAQSAGHEGRTQSGLSDANAGPNGEMRRDDL